MNKFLIRNDDVAYDTKFSELKTFCEICDRYGFPILQAVTFIGECKKAHQSMPNKKIREVSNRLFKENQEVLKYLKGRSDLIGVHGLWHTHEPSEGEIHLAKALLEMNGLEATYFVPPFNEGNYGEVVEGLKVCKLDLRKGERLEDFLKRGTPRSNIMYLHSWRFDNDWYTFEQLENCLRRLCQLQ